MEVVAHPAIFAKHMLLDPENRIEPSRYVGCPYTQQELENLGAMFNFIDHTEEISPGLWFVAVLPRKGFQVNVLKEKDIQDMFEYRNGLERAVIFHVTPEMADRSIEAIESLNAQAAATRDRIRFLKFDRGFHRYLTSLTQNQYIITALENIWDLCDWVGGEIFHLKNRPEEAVREHVAVAEMLKKRDAQGAAEAMTEHLRITEMRFHQLMSDKNPKT